MRSRCLDLGMGNLRRAGPLSARHMKLAIAFVLAVFAVSANAQEQLRIIKSTSSIVSIQDGDNYRHNIWRLVPEIKPDVYESQLKDGKPHRVTFITDLESISFWVELGKKYDFIIQRGDDLCYTQIIGVKYEIGRASCRERV